MIQVSCKNGIYIWWCTLKLRDQVKKLKEKRPPKRSPQNYIFCLIFNTKRFSISLNFDKLLLIISKKLTTLIIN
jgi:hypothetical protein